MRWEKRGVIVAPQGERTHAALPCIGRAGGEMRVYFSTRDAASRADIRSLPLDPRRSAALPSATGEIALSPGALGTFDDHGVTSSCVVEHEGATYLYYTGWTLGRTVPFYLFAGLAVRPAGATGFRRASEAPLLDRSAADPYLTASPYVLVDEGVWRMWYVSGTGWRRVAGEPQHRYHIRYAESADGVAWRRAGVVCIDYAADAEYALGRPCVVKDPDGYRMWYCYRGDAYRIGYAESDDGLRWVRRDDVVGIDVSPQGWDSGMVAYPFVFDFEGVRYMLYNGNDYGRTGIGLAVAVAAQG